MTCWWKTMLHYIIVKYLYIKMKVLEWHAGRCLRLLVMKTKFWSHVLPLLTEPTWNFDPDKSFECASQIWCISSDLISILWCKAGLQPVIGIIVWNSRTGVNYILFGIRLLLCKNQTGCCLSVCQNQTDLGVALTKFPDIDRRWPGRRGQTREQTQ